MRQKVKLIYNSKLVGAKIYIKRKEKKISRGELAKKSNCSLSQIINIEKGHSPGSFNTLCLIATALDMKISYLIEGALPYPAK